MYYQHSAVMTTVVDMKDVACALQSGMCAAVQVDEPPLGSGGENAWRTMVR